MKPWIAIEEYDHHKLVVERLQVASSKFGDFILGESKLGVNTTQWVSIPMATFKYDAEYQVNDAGVFIVGTERASVSISTLSKTRNIARPLEPSDKVRITYDGAVFADTTFVVDTVERTCSRHRDQHGYYTIDDTATLLGYYALAMTKTVCFGNLPAETALQRIQRFVKIKNPGVL